MSYNDGKHFRVAHQSWALANSIEHGQTILLTGENLDIATVVAAARYDTLISDEGLLFADTRCRKNCSPRLSDQPGLESRINDSVRLLEDYLSRGHTVYGRWSKVSTLTF